MESDVRKPNYDLSAQIALLEKLHAHFDKDVISLKELNAFCENKKNGVENFPYFILRERKVGRGEFSIAPNSKTVAAPVKKKTASVAAAAPAFAAQVVNIASRRAQNVTEIGRAHV